MILPQTAGFFHFPAMPRLTVSRWLDERTAAVDGWTAVLGRDDDAAPDALTELEAAVGEEPVRLVDAWLAGSDQRHGHHLLRPRRNVRHVTARRHVRHVTANHLTTRNTCSSSNTFSPFT